jgi:hypothetical protein
MAYTDLTIDQGTDFVSGLDLEADDGSPINVASYVFTSQIRKSYYSVNATANIVCTIANAAMGNVIMTISAANTANIASGRYVYDVKMKDSANVVTRIVEGIVTVTPQVTA